MGTRALLLAALLVCAYASAARAEDAPSAEALDVELRHAETYYWFGMAERGNMAAYAKGLRHLDRARRLVEENVAPAEADAYRARIEALRTDLEEQAELGHDTLYGVFPLYRFWGPSVFGDQANLDTFELLDDPRVMVTTAAAKKLALTTLQRWTQRAQLDVLVLSTPRAPDLENEALYVFNTIPKFFVHNERELVDALTPAQLTALRAGRAGPDVLRRLLVAFDAPELLVVLVRETDVVDGDHFYVVEARLYGASSPTPVHKLAVMGFSRDRRAQLVPILVTTLLLLLFAFVAYAAFVTWRRRAAGRIPREAFLVAPLLAFVAGRTAPWILAPLLRRVAPTPENLAVVSFWAPLVAGVTMLTLPMFAHWAFAARASRLFPALTFRGRGAATCAAIGAGVVAYLAVPAFLYLEGLAPWMLLGTLLATTCIASMLGRALDPVDRLHGAFAVLACILAAALGVAFFRGSLGWVYAVAGLALAAWLVLFVPRVRAEEPPAVGEATPADGSLVERAEKPTFQPTTAYETAWRRLAPWREGRTAELLLLGAFGCGRSAHLDALVARAEQEADEADAPLVVLRGEGGRGGADDVPYAPFRRALAGHFEVRLLDGDEEGLDGKVGGIFQSFVPFGAMLFPDASGAATATSRAELFASVVWTLRRLARSRRVLLVLDDIDGFDEASVSLLAYLLADLRREPGAALAVVGSGIDGTTAAERAFSDADPLTVSMPSEDEQRALLVHGVGLAPRTASAIVERVGLGPRTAGGLTWLLRVVADQARAGAFVVSPDGYAWEGDAWPADRPLPNELRDGVRDELARHAEARTTLLAAACAAEGRRFPVDGLAQALARPRFDLLLELDRIAEATGLLEKARDDDDVTFPSLLVLDVLAAELGVSPPTPLAREIHARLGAFYEQRLARGDRRALYAAARHFHAAGRRHAEAGLALGIRAAEAYAAAADFEGAEHALSRAEACAEAIGQSDRMTAARLVVACQRAHVTGTAEERVRVADEAWAYCAAHADASDDVVAAAAQVHYDAVHATADGARLERLGTLGQRLVREGGTPLARARGHHFLGLARSREERPLRIEAFERALEVLAEADADAEVMGDAEAGLRGRVLGSLAEELVRGNASDQARARALLEERLSLLEGGTVRDPKGLATTHGGLGRLAFFGADRDLDRARRHFAEDLELSERLGDRDGQVQMQSLLGACALEQGRPDDALEHYEASWRLAADGAAFAFAGAGLLGCHAARGDGERVERVCREVLASFEGEARTLPPEPRRALATAVSAIPSRLRGESIAALEAAITGN